MAHTNHHFKCFIVFVLLTCSAQTAFSFSFTKLDALGTILPDSARDWAMVKDNVTGLIWEVKTASDEQSNYDDPHDPDNTYTWYDSNPDSNGGDPGIDGDNTDTEDFINAINTARFGKFSDWRMPTKEELLSIIDYNAVGPAIDTAYFKNTISSYYWTATTFSDSIDNAIKINFNYGTEGYHEKSGAYYVRAVRSDTQKSSISGTIYKSDGVTPLTGEYVDIDVFQGDPCGISNLVQSVSSEFSTGKYLISGLQQGIYYIKTHTYSNSSYISEWWASGSSKYDCGLAEPITVDANQEITGRDFQLDSTSPADAGILQFTSLTYQISEAGGKVTVTVSRTGGSSGAISVSYALAAPAGTVTTATEGSDFTLPVEPHTLAWEDGDVSDKTFDIRILDDTAVEQEEFFLLELINPTDGATLGTHYLSKIKITDDDKLGTAISFTQNSYSANERRGSVTISVQRTQSSAGTVSVSYVIKESGTTATEHTDFALPEAAHTLTWLDGDTKEKTFEIQIIDDTDSEEAEFITLELAVPLSSEGAALGIYPETRITIFDNDINDIQEITEITDIIDNVQNETDAESVTDKLDSDVALIEESMPDAPSEPPSDELVNAINTTIENVGSIIEISNTLFKEEQISSEQALTTLQLLDDIIELGADVAKREGKVSIEKVAASVEFVEEIVAQAVSQDATAEQMSNSSGNINNMLDNMADIMNAVLITDDVVELLDPIEGLTGGGIIAALASGGDSTQTVDTVDNLGDIVVKGLQDAKDAGIISNTGRIINSAGGITNHAINTLLANTDDQEIIQGTLDQCQIELGAMIDQTALNIKEKPVPSKSAGSSGKYAVTGDDNASLEEFKALMESVSGLTTALIKSRSVLKSHLSGKMQSLSDETIKNILPHFISTTSSAALKSDSDIQSLLEDYPQFLNEVIEIASVNLTEGMSLTSEDIEAILESNQSFDASEIERLIRGLPLLPAFDQDIIQPEGSTALSLVDLLRDELQNLLPDTTVEVSSLNGIYLKIVVKISPELELPLYIQDARVVSDLIPQDLYLLPEGTIILVRKGIAGIITPAPLDAVDTLLSADSLLEIDSLFGSDEKEVESVKLSNSGNLNLIFDDGGKFSGAFSYVAAKDGDGDFDAGTSSFELHGTDPASEAYSVLVEYNDGYTQQLPPAVSALEQLVEVLDTLAAGSYSLDSATGIITVFDIRFKPSYLIESITPAEENWFNVNKDGYGIAWEGEDYNKDGAIDLKMWTEDGKQVIYTVVQ